MVRPNKKKWPYHIDIKYAKLSCKPTYWSSNSKDATEIHGMVLGQALLDLHTYIY